MPTPFESDERNPFMPDEALAENSAVESAPAPSAPPSVLTAPQLPILPAPLAPAPAPASFVEGATNYTPEQIKAIVDAALASQQNVNAIAPPVVPSVTDESAPAPKPITNVIEYKKGKVQDAPTPNPHAPQGAPKVSKDGYYEEESLFYSDEAGASDEAPTRWSDAFEEGPFRFYICEIDGETKKWNYDFFKRVGQRLGLDELIAEELREEQEFARARYERELDNYDPTRGEGKPPVAPKELVPRAFEREVADRVRNVVERQSFHSFSDEIDFTYVNREGEEVTEANVSLSYAFDLMVEERVNRVLDKGLVKWDCSRKGVPARSSQSIRDLKLKIKQPVFERILTLSSYGLNDRFFRNASA